MNDLFPEKTYTINGETLTVRPLSFYDIVTKAPEVFARLIKKVDGQDVSDMNTSQLIVSAAEEVFFLMELATGKKAEYWKNIPGDRGFQILSDFLDITLTENFFKALKGLKDVGNRIGSQLPKSFLAMGTDTQTLKDTLSDK